MKSIMLIGLILLFIVTPGVCTAQSDNSAINNTTIVIIDDIEPDEGIIGPDNVVYGLKIAFENLDETFTFEKSEKLAKQEFHAKQRLAEVKSELKKNKPEISNKALKHYIEKIKMMEDSISEFDENESDLFPIQLMIVKHKYVLEQLLASHPDNAGIQRAYSKSLELEEEFEFKTERKLERTHTQDHQFILKEVKKKEYAKIKAEILDDAAQIKVRFRFISNSTEDTDIAGEIQNKITLIDQNITSLLVMETEDEEENEILEEKLKAEAEIENGVSKIKFEYKFPLNETNRTQIIAGIHQKLSALTTDDILHILEIEVEDEEHDEVEHEDEEEELKDKLEAEAEIESGTSDIEIKYQFKLNETNRTEIIEGIYQKLSSLTADDISNALDIDVEGEQHDEVEHEDED